MPRELKGYCGGNNGDYHVNELEFFKSPEDESFSVILTKKKVLEVISGFVDCYKARINRYTQLPDNTLGIDIGKYIYAYWTPDTAYGFGYYSYGALGYYEGNNTIGYSKIPRIIYQSSKKIKTVVCGSKFICILFEGGTVKYSGQICDSVRIQVGFKDALQYNEDKMIEPITNVRKISAGRKHCAIIKQDNTLWMMGDNEDKQLFLDRKKRTSKFRKTEYEVKDVSCGSFVTFIITLDNRILSTGKNCNRIISNNNEWNSGENVDKPYVEHRLPDDYIPEKLYSGDFHTLVITKLEETGDDQLFGIGSNGHNQLTDCIFDNYSEFTRINVAGKIISMQVASYNTLIHYELHLSWKYLRQIYIGHISTDKGNNSLLRLLPIELIRKIIEMIANITYL